ncbi:hypothetical protein ACI8AK_05195 [Geodermatophilus sp. SYSU D00867]
MTDPFKILKDLELKATGLDPETSQQQEGYFVAFRDIGLPIRREDFIDPFHPNRKAQVSFPENTDPKDVKGSGAKQAGLDPEKVYEDLQLAEINREMRAFLNTHMITNVKLQMSNRYTVMPGASTVFDTWWAIVTGAQGIPGNLELSPEIKEAVSDAEALLMDEESEPTRAYEKYLEYSDAYDEAQEDYYLAWADASTNPDKIEAWPTTGNLLRRKLDKALDRWRALGRKEAIEGALDILAAQGRDPAMALISKAKRDLEQNLFDFPGVGQLPITTVLPANWADERDDRGWNSYTKTDFHSETHVTRSSTSIQASAGFSLGFWKVGGNFGYDKQRKAMNFQTDNLEISFDYMIADVQSAVVKPTLLGLSNWFLYGDYPAHCVSDGTMGQHLPQDGTELVFLPSMITGLILIKDLRIKWDSWKSQWDEQTSSLGAGASVGWGPFAVSGSYSSKNYRLDASTDRESEGLTTKGIQLVGYVSQIMPASPKVASRDHMQ